MSVSSAVVIFKGIEFGEEKCGKWLSSLIISFFTSVLLTQPLKVSGIIFKNYLSTSLTFRLFWWHYFSY
jgi:hypothetical protein